MTMMESIFFILVFVSPHTLCSITPPEYNSPIQLATVAAYFFTFVLRPSLLRKVFSGTSFAIIAAYFLFVVLRFSVYHSFSLFAVLMPMAAFTGYYYLCEYKINLKAFGIYLLFLYVFFIITYYSKLPSLFFRGAFADGNWYGGSSSNSIPIAIINVLYIYYIVAYFQKNVNNGKFLLLSLVNFSLVFIQQSRVGIVTSALFFLYCYYKYSESRSKFVRYVPIVLTAFVIFVYGGSFFSSYFEDQVGAIGLSAYEDDCRNRTVNYFFDHMGSVEFFAGYPPGTEFDPQLDYIYNMWLEHWNTYTIFGFILIVSLFVRRICNYKRYYFPVIFFVPMLFYGYMEPRYLPNFWDFFIYLLLFVKRA